MRPLSVLHTESSCGWGGQELRILSEASGLIERGHAVTLVCPPEARICEEAARFGVPVQALPIARKNFVGLRALRAWFRGRRFDVINTHSSTDSWLVALGRGALDGAVPIVRTRHISAQLSGDILTGWLYRRATAHVVTTGERLRLQLIAQAQLDPKRVTSVPTGIDTQCYAPADRKAARARFGLSPDVRLLGIVATLRSWKGHLFLIEAFARLARADLGMVVVGDGPMRGNLEARARELGVFDRMLFAGNQNNVEQWLPAFDVFALPSYANEGVPQALMQAMLCALPCVTTDVGSIGEIALHEQTALVVPPRDAEALATAIARLLDDTELASGLGRAAREHVAAGYSRERMVGRMIAVFDSVRAAPRADSGAAAP